MKCLCERGCFSASLLKSAFWSISSFKHSKNFKLYVNFEYYGERTAHIVDSEGNTLLMLAAKIGNLDAVKLLFSYPVFINHQNVDNLWRTSYKNY